MTLPLSSIIRFLILGDFFLIPFAHIKCSLFGLPLYALEIPLIIAGAFFCYGYMRKISPFETAFFPDRIFAAGAVLFLSGSLLSFVTNPFSLTGLGMLKSSIFFPMLAAFLWLKTSFAEKHRLQLFAAWFAVSTCIAIASLGLFSRGALTYDGRLEGWYTSPNFLAILLAPAILIGTYLLEHLFSQAKKCFWLIGMVSLSITLLSITLFLTRSYGAWIATAISLFALLFLFSATRKTKIVLSIALVLMSALLISSQSDSEKWHSLASFQERSSLSSRIMIWRSAGKILSDHPIIGIGIGRFQEEYLAYQKYFPPYLEWTAPEPHDLLLAIWLETGLLGLTGLALILGHLASLLARKIHIATAHSHKKTGSILVLSLLFLFLLYGIMDTPYFTNDLSFLFWMLIAAGIASVTDRSDTADASADR